MSSTQLIHFGLFENLRFLNQEDIFFAQDPSFGFPVIDAEFVEKNNKVVVTTYFLSFLGAQGVLPDPIKVLALNQDHKKESSLIDFLNIFHHHWVCFFHRVWQSQYFFLVHEKYQGHFLAQPLLSFVLGLAGESANQYSEFLIRYNHFFSAHPRPLLGLEQMLCDYFECPIRACSFVGEWVGLADHQQMQLGVRHSFLGVDAMPGEKIEQVQNKFRIEIGPLNYLDYFAWSPNSERRLALKEMVTLFVGGGFCFDVVVRILPSEIPALCLGGEGVVLGWVGWV